MTITTECWLEVYKHSSTRVRPSREILERAIHMTRHHCRFVLQLCAVLSQLNEHEKALIFSKKASDLGSELCQMTMILINDELKPPKVHDSSQVTDDKRSVSVKKRKHSTSNQLDPYTSLSKQKTTVSARLNNHNNSQRASQNSSLVQSNLNNLSKDKVSQSYTMSNFHSIQDANKQNTMNNSGMQLSYFPNPEQIKNERESLERIHTFSLKEPSEE